MKAKPTNELETGTQCIADTESRLRTCFVQKQG